MGEAVWSDEQVNVLKQLWQEGLSASKVAEKLNEMFLSIGAFFSRNAVLSKLHREGAQERSCGTLVKKHTPYVYRDRRQKLTQIISSQIEMPLQPSFLCEPIPCRTIVTVGWNECRFPHGETAPYQICGAPTPEGSSWCLYHFNIVSQPRLKHPANKAKMAP